MSPSQDSFRSPSTMFQHVSRFSVCLCQRQIGLSILSSPDLSPIQLPWLPSNRDDDFKTSLRYIRIHLTQIKSIMNKDGHLWLHQAAHVSPEQSSSAWMRFRIPCSNAGKWRSDWWSTMIDPKVPKGLKPAGKVPHPSYKAKSLQNLGG